MGQAKNRGDFEQRRALSIEKKANDSYARKMKLIAAEAAMTPEQKAKRKKATQMFATMMGIAEGFKNGR